MNPKVLLVDRNTINARVLTAALEERGFHVLGAASAPAALDALVHLKPHVVVIVSAPPELDGVALCSGVRAVALAPVIVISPAADEAMALDAFEAGADDHIARSFSHDHLAARIRAVLRRGGVVLERPTLAVGDFQIDFGERRVRYEGAPVKLTPKEFDLFVFMAQNPNRVLTHRTLLSNVWGPQSEEQPEYLRVFVGQLRKKLDSPSKPRYIVTEPWVGYRFDPTGAARANQAS